jgi:hypothetical protein
MGKISVIPGAFDKMPLVNSKPISSVFGLI